MAVVFNDVVPVRHLLKRDLRLLLLGVCSHRAFGRGCEKGQRFVAQ
jgi:hypothetical protein